MNTRLDVAALARAGAFTGAVLYLVCLAFYFTVYGGTGPWMLRPFMPGVTSSVGGYVLGFVWAVAYGAGTLWLIAWGYNRALRPGSASGPA